MAGVHLERVHGAVVASVREECTVAIEATALGPAVAVVTNEDLAEKVQGLGALRRFVGDVAPELVVRPRVGGGTHRGGQPIDGHPEVEVEADLVVDAGVVAEIGLVIAVRRVAYGHRVTAVCSPVE